MRDEWHVEDILERLPKDVQGIGEEVLQAISCSRQLLSWNNQLQLVIDNRSVPRTNIVDLVQYILYPESKDTSQPRGFEVFLDALKEIGLESQWVRNETVINALDNNENNWDTTDEEDDTSESDSSEKSDDDDENEDENDEEMDCSTTQVLNKDSSSNIKWKNLSSSSSSDENEN